MKTPSGRLGLVATDLDGTLLGSDDKVSARTRAAVHASLSTGARFVIATGRPPRWTGPVAATLGVNGVALCANGAITYDLAAGKVLRSRLMATDASRATVAGILAVLPDAAFAIELADGGLAHDPAYVPKWPMPAGTIVAPVKELINRPIVKMLVRYDGHAPDALFDIVRRAVNGFAHATQGGSDTLIEIMAIGANKGDALAELAAEWDIDANHCVAFGDMPNDIEMLQWAGLGVAMDNAHATVRAVADHVTHSNDDHGVAAVLERLVG